VQIQAQHFGQGFLFLFVDEKVQSMFGRWEASRTFTWWPKHFQFSKSLI